MANKTVSFTSANIGVSTAQATVSRINLKPDGSGDWNIGLDFNVTSPSRNAAKDETVSLMERHLLSASIIVKRAEIAAAITEEEVRTSLTLDQTETHVTTIALGKLFTAMGITAANVVVS